MIYESNKVFLLLKIYWLLYLEFLHSFFHDDREKSGSLFSRERIVGGEWYRMLRGGARARAGPSRATKSQKTSRFLDTHLAKTAMRPLLVSTGPNRSNDVTRSPTGVIPKRWVLVCAIGLYSWLYCSFCSFRSRNLTIFGYRVRSAHCHACTKYKRAWKLRQRHEVPHRSEVQCKPGS